VKKKFRDIINQQNALRSTGPKTAAGKKRSSLNAFKHGLSGNPLVMQKHEFEAYELLTGKMLADLKPVTEPEKQIAQKIIDLNFRINRITAIENNMLNFDMTDNEPNFEEDDGIAAMMGQASAWKKEAHAFEILGRYEARLSKQLLQYQKELERLQATRALPNHDPSIPFRGVGCQGVAGAQTTQTAPLKPESASFGKTTPEYLMSAAALPTVRPDIPLPPASDRPPAQPRL
jgi:hypothetical protein